MIKSFKTHSLLESLLNESILKYSTKFKEVLMMMSSPVSMSLLSAGDSDIKTTVNFIGIEGDDMVKFSPDKSDTVETFQVLRSMGFIDMFNFPNFKSELGINFIVPPINSKIYKISDLDNSVVVKCYPNWSGIKVIHFKIMVGDSPSSKDENSLLHEGYLNSVEPHDFVYSKKQVTRIGRISKKILNSIGVKFSDREIEEFVNEFKSKSDLIKNNFRNFEIVNGEEIKYWYNEENYSMNNRSTLQSSCMRNVDPSFFNLYSKNRSISLLINKTDDKESITGRAMVWKLENGDTMMDRVYYSKDSEYNLFVEYARSNNWVYLDRNMQPILDGVNYTKPISVKLEKSGFEYYPYVDSISILLPNENRLLFDDDLPTGVEYYVLNDTRGSQSEHSCGKCGAGRITCPVCKGQRSVKCKSCDGGKVKCEICDGSDQNCKCEDGYVECLNCYGDSFIECDNCDGDGFFECEECW